MEMKPREEKCHGKEPHKRSSEANRSRPLVPLHKDCRSA